MKALVYIALALLVIGCKTKTVELEKSRQKELSEMKSYFDSLFQLSLKHQLDWQKSQLSIRRNMVLSSTLEVDSLGNKKPFHFKHYVDGDLKEEIFLEGGEINTKTETKETEINEKKQESKVEKGRIEVGVGQKKLDKKSDGKKAKVAKVQGFQFSFYLWLFLIIVVLIVLNWVFKKVKIPDKLSSIFGNKGG